MIFGDYDVDGICASYVLYTCLRTFFNFHTVTVRLPHRVHDGYGIKNKHIDMAHALWCGLIITVDNGITAVQEAEYAKEVWIDLLVTDHHHAPQELPTALALVNPQLSSMEFKEVCGATVTLKLCCALADTVQMPTEKKKQMMDMMMPFVAIATVADCMPLIQENRLIVKEWLRLMNEKRSELVPSLQVLLEQLWIEKVDTYHIGYVIWPRFNATWRIDDAMEWFKALLYSDHQKLIKQIAHMDTLNLRRKEIQEQMIDTAKSQIDYDQSIMIASSDTFHEWIVGIVAWRITEETQKPSVIFSLNTAEWIATASMRAPHRFSIIEMLDHTGHLLERYGGHEQAWGLTVQLTNLEKLQEAMKQFATHRAATVDTTKRIIVDTYLHDYEYTIETVTDLKVFAPYWMWNQSPLFLLENVTIIDTRVLGKWSRTHLKLTWQYWSETISCMRRWAWEDAMLYPWWKKVSVIGRLKEDTWTKWVMVEVKEIVT